MERLTVCTALCRRPLTVRCPCMDSCSSHRVARVLRLASHIGLGRAARALGKRKRRRRRGSPRVEPYQVGRAAGNVHCGLRGDCRTHDGHPRRRPRQHGPLRVFRGSPHGGRGRGEERLEGIDGGAVCMVARCTHRHVGGRRDKMGDGLCHCVMATLQLSTACLPPSGALAHTCLPALPPARPPAPSHRSP